MSFDFYKRAAIVCRAIPYGKAASSAVRFLTERPRHTGRSRFCAGKRRMRVRWDMR